MDRRNKRWKRPYFNWMKCNFDGSFSTNTSVAKAGWLIRDDNGMYRGAVHSIGNQVFSPLEVECQALLMVMHHSWMRGYQRMEFEGDCKRLIDLLNGNDQNFRFHYWIREIKAWEKKFVEVKFS